MDGWLSGRTQGVMVGGWWEYTSSSMSSSIEWHSSFPNADQQPSIPWAPGPTAERTRMDPHVLTHPPTHVPIISSDNGGGPLALTLNVVSARWALNVFRPWSLASLRRICTYVVSPAAPAVAHRG